MAAVNDPVPVTRTNIFRNMKSLLIKYRPAVIILAFVLALVLLRLADRNGFRTDASRHGSEATDRSNIVSMSELGSLTGDNLVLLLDDSDMPFPVPAGMATDRIAADSILQDEYAGLFRQENKSVLLYSSDISVSAGVWMILRQTGIDNIRILTADPGNETLKFK